MPLVNQLGATAPRIIIHAPKHNPLNANNNAINEALRNATDHVDHDR
jgi:hypothetical protein